MFRVDLNSDLGESFGTYKIGNDEEILKFVTSVNIACGFHGGDPSVMRKTVKLALENGVAIGAHPGLPDLIGFGRRNLAISPQEAYDMVIYQIGALNGFIKAQGGVIQHVKPHGALYNMAAKDEKLAKAIAEAIYDINPELMIYGLANSEITKQGKIIGLKTVNEVFADRTYQYDGTLTPRNNPGAMVIDEKEAINRVIKMVKEKKVLCMQGYNLPIEADTVCIHGDGEKALNFAREISQALVDADIKISSFK